MVSVNEPRKYLQRKGRAGQAEPVTTACEKKIKSINSKQILPCLFSSLTNPFGLDSPYQTMGIGFLSLLYSQCRKTGMPKVFF